MHRATAAAAWATALVAVASCTRASEPARGSIPTTAREPPGPIRHVVLVSIDGLLPDAYLHPDAHALRVPALRAVAARGATSDGALSVFPSVTYPAHTTLVTGVRPAAHGIESNLLFDPLARGPERWNHYAEDIRRDTIWSLVERAGYDAALVGWPVSVGARVKWLFPEDVTALHDGDAKLLRALSTPGLLEAVAAERPDLWSRYFGGGLDDATTDVAIHALTTGRPAFLALHLLGVDGAQHHAGLWSAEAIAAMEEDDRQLGRLVQAMDGAGLVKDSVLVVASDHGFTSVTRRIRPGVLLRDAGLVTVAPGGRAVEWRASILPNVAQAYIYLRDPADTEAEAIARRVFTERARDPGSGIARVYDREAIREVGGDPAAVLAIEATPGVQMDGGFDGDYEAPPTYRGAHGYDPRRPEMRASLLAAGATIPHGTIRDARLVDVAPTIAAWLGLAMPAVEGRPLTFTAAP